MMDQAPKLPPKPLREQAKVLYAYDAQNEDELTIKEGDIINVISKEIEDQGWFKGELNGKVGVFPDNFVELIKVPVVEEDKPLPPRPNKTPSVSSSSPSAISALVSALGKNKSSSSSSTDGNSHSNGSSKAASETPVSVKTSIFGLKKSNKSPSSSIVSTSSKTSVKSESVPQESNSLNESSTASVSIAASNVESVATGIEGLSVSTASSKLNHLTANRAKGPSNRRPPSYVSGNNNTSPSKEPLSSHYENGVEKTNGSSTVTPSLIRAASVSSETSSVKSVASTTTGATSPGSKAKENPPWMVELRKTQEAKKGLKTGVSLASDPSSHAPHLQERSVSLDSTSSTESPPIASNRLVPEKTPVSSSSPNRTSGDFSSRVGQFNGSSDSSAASLPVSILKPTKPVKPPSQALGSTTIVSSSSSPSTTTSSIAANNNHNNSSPSTTTTSSSPSSSANSLTSSSKTTSEGAQHHLLGSSSTVKGSSSELIGPTSTTSQGVSSSSLNDLQKELKSLKESSVSRKEFDDLAKQVRRQTFSSISFSFSLHCP
jgi:hypothetical protein